MGVATETRQERQLDGPAVRSETHSTVFVEVMCACLDTFFPLTSGIRTAEVLRPVTHSVSQLYQECWAVPEPEGPMMASIDPGST